MEFNESQKRAVRHCDGPMLLLAGPGSGKTTVITHRIKYITEEHGVTLYFSGYSEMHIITQRRISSRIQKSMES